jgi:hypothetical protein
MAIGGIGTFSGVFCEVAQKKLIFIAKGKIMEAEEHTNDRLSLAKNSLADKLILSGTFLACARGTVVLDSRGEFSAQTVAVPDADSEAFKDAFILFSRN